MSFLIRAPVIYFQTIHFNCVDFCECCFTYAKTSFSTDFSPLQPWTQNSQMIFLYGDTHNFGLHRFSKTNLGCASYFHAQQLGPSVLFIECMSVYGKFLVLFVPGLGGTSSDRGMFKLGKLLSFILVLGMRLMQ